MQRPHLSTGAWIFVSVVTAAVLVPTGVYAASAASTVKIQSGSGTTTATVDPAGQLLAAETPAGGDVVVFGYVTDGSCAALYTVPATKALIIKSVNFYLFDDSKGGQVEQDLESGSSCSGVLAAGVAPNGSDVTQNDDLGPGLAIPAGTVMTTYARNSGGSVEIYGYLVPKNAVPADALATLARTSGQRAGTERSGTSAK